MGSYIHLLDFLINCFEQLGNHNECHLQNRIQTDRFAPARPYVKSRKAKGCFFLGVKLILVLGKRPVFKNANYFLDGISFTRWLLLNRVCRRDVVENLKGIKEVCLGGVRSNDA